METRVYVIALAQIEDHETLDSLLVNDDAFIEEAENQGTVYTLKGFERAYNNECTFSQSDSYIKIITQ